MTDHDVKQIEEFEFVYVIARDYKEAEKLADFGWSSRSGAESQLSVLKDGEALAIYRVKKRYATGKVTDQNVKQIEERIYATVREAVGKELRAIREMLMEPKESPYNQTQTFGPGYDDDLLPNMPRPNRPGDVFKKAQSVHEHPPYNFGMGICGIGKPEPKPEPPREWPAIPETDPSYAKLREARQLAEFLLSSTDNTISAGKVTDHNVKEIKEHIYATVREAVGKELRAIREMMMEPKESPVPPWWDMEWRDRPTKPEPKPEPPREWPAIPETDPSTDNTISEAGKRELCEAIVELATRCGIHSGRPTNPARPERAPCPQCDGTGWRRAYFFHGSIRDGPPQRRRISEQEYRRASPHSVDTGVERCDCEAARRG